MNDPWPRFKSFVFCTMIFVVFGTLMKWSDLLTDTTKGIDGIIGKLVFLLAVIAIALILLVQRLDLKWISRISMVITFCLLYYIFTFNYRYNIETSSLNEGLSHIGEGIYITLFSSILTTIASTIAAKKQVQ